MEWCCIAAVNDPRVLESNLAASPAFRFGTAKLAVFQDQPSASFAYNKGLDSTLARICVFAHQDVYLPFGWDDKISQQVSMLDRIDPNWAVAGVFGVSLQGACVGRVWSTGIGKEIGEDFNAPVPAQSLDELVIVMNRESGLRFDQKLPSFHLYATDIVQTALQSGLGAYIVNAPVVHNSVPTAGLRGGYMAAYDYMRGKWRSQLPLVTPVTKITPSGWYLRWQDFRKFRLSPHRLARVRSAMNEARPDPRAIAKDLGYE